MSEPFVSDDLDIGALVDENSMLHAQNLEQAKEINRLRVLAKGKQSLNLASAVKGYPTSTPRRTGATDTGVRAGVSQERAREKYLRIRESISFRLGLAMDEYAERRWRIDRLFWRLLGIFSDIVFNRREYRFYEQWYKTSSEQVDWKRLSRDIETSSAWLRTAWLRRIGDKSS